MNIRFRRARAQSRVKAASLGLRRREESVSLVENDVELEHEDDFDFDEARGEIIHRRRGIPLRCAPPLEGVTKGGRGRQAKCGGCMQTVKESDVATVCEMGGGCARMSQR